jgi:hypothetical protein
MAMSQLAWWLVAVLALACVALLGLLWQRRGAPGRDPAERREAPVAVAVEPRASRPEPGSVPGGGLAPLPGPAAPPRSPVAALVAPPAVRLPATLVAARARRYELRDAGAEPALTLERAGAVEWRQASPLSATPMQREVLSAMLAHAPLLAVPGFGDADLFRLSLRAGAALPLARGELAASSLRVAPAQSLDANRAAAVAAVVMALHCAPVYLHSLRQEVAAIQAEAADWLRLSSPEDERLRALLQELSRYLREVEENHAGAVRKPVFVARVADFGAQTEAQWRVAGDAGSAQRLRVATALAGPALAPADWLALVQAYALRQRVACHAARMLSAWHGLRLALGEAVPAATLVLHAALQAQRAANRDDAGLARSAAARGWAWPLAPEPGLRAERSLAAALQAIEAGFAGEVGLTLLVRLDSLGRVCEVRSPPLPD